MPRTSPTHRASALLMAIYTLLLALGAALPLAAGYSEEGAHRSDEHSQRDYHVDPLRAAAPARS